MSLARSAREPWLAAPRAEAERRSEELGRSARFDWRRVERPARLRGPSLGRILPAAVALVIGLGLALGWALTREDVAPEPVYLLADVAAAAGASVGEAPSKRLAPTKVLTPPEERAVQGRRARRASKPAMAALPEKGEKKAKLGGYAPAVIIVKPPARLPPLFSTEAYRRRR